MVIEINGMTPLIEVFNMPRALAFYRGILGFEVVSDSGNGDDSSWVWLQLNGCDLMLNGQYEPGRVPPADRPTAFAGITTLVCILDARMWMELMSIFAQTVSSSNHQRSLRMV